MSGSQCIVRVSASEMAQIVIKLYSKQLRPKGLSLIKSGTNTMKNSAICDMLLLSAEVEAHRLGLLKF